MKRLRAERRIASRIAAFLDAAPDAMMVIGRDGRILAANTHAVTLFGYGAAELIGLPVERLVPEQFRRGHEAHRQRYADDPHPRLMGAELELSGLHKLLRELRRIHRRERILVLQLCGQQDEKRVVIVREPGA